MAGFSKVFSTIWGGSLYGHFEASAVFLVFLSLADRDGTVDMTPEAIAGTTGWPLDFILKGISDLEAPDSKSRTPGHEGRRIMLMDEHRAWGWVITNYALYRDKMRSAERTAYLAEKQREYRAKLKSQGIKPTQHGIKAKPHEGFVYFIQAENKVKIGFSLQPEERLAALKTGNPLASLIGFKEGSTTFEKELHKRFEKYSAGGEWFDFVEEIREYIKSISPLYTSIQQVYTSTIINQDKPIAEADAEADSEAKNKKVAPLPAWLPESLWNDFKEMRRKIRAPMTPRAEALIIRSAERLKAAGHDPVACMELSIERGWKGVFAPNGDSNGTRRTSGGQSAPERVRAANAKYR